MSYQLPLWVWPTALLSVCAIAVWRGRDDERLAAGGLLANWAISVLVARAASTGAHWEALVVDTALLGLFLWLALRSRRHWPRFCTGFQVLVVVTHLGRGVDPTVSSWAYMTAGIIWSYLVLFSIGYGAWTAPAAYADSAAATNEDPGDTRR